MRIKLHEQHCNDKIPKNLMYPLAGFEPMIFCSIGGDDDHYTAQTGQLAFLFSTGPVRKLSVPFGYRLAQRVVGIFVILSPLYQQNT
jgi:hypothetical protein